MDSISFSKDIFVDWMRDLLPLVDSKITKLNRQFGIESAKFHASFFPKRPQPTHFIGSGCYGRVFATTNSKMVFKQQVSSSKDTWRRFKTETGMWQAQQTYPELLKYFAKIYWVDEDGMLVWKERVVAAGPIREFIFNEGAKYQALDDELTRIHRNLRENLYQYDNLFKGVAYGDFNYGNWGFRHNLEPVFFDV